MKQTYFEITYSGKSTDDWEKVIKVSLERIEEIVYRLNKNGDQVLRIIPTGE